MNPAIVIPCFDRIKQLKRLVQSLLNAKYPQNVTLVFSVDYSGSDIVKNFAENFEWPYGNKEVISHKYNIGLRENIIFCGSLSQTYGSVIILEDDLFVSNFFYQYALSAQEKYQNDNNIAGISLYAYEYSEILLEKFYPLHTGFSTYFMQWASSRGQLWTYSQWNDFKNWYNLNEKVDLKSFNIPDCVISWPESSWKKYFIAYLVDVNKFFVYPYMSYVTNCGDKGVHSDGVLFADKQVSIPLKSETIAINFSDFESSIAIKYDCFFQIHRSFFKFHDVLNKFVFDVDIAGNKKIKNFKTSYVLTNKECNSYIFEFGKIILPFELNVIYNIKGNDLKFCKVSDIKHSLSLKKKVKNIVDNREILTLRKCLCIVIVEIYDRVCKRICFLLYKIKIKK